ncbi:MAG TPA: hypothetical protein VNW06_08220, partial [Cytophagaceae bacterium]|nr:hypothetical protein [Cytophagaceae bacterium]
LDELKVGDRFFMLDFQGQDGVYFTLTIDCPKSDKGLEGHWEVKFTGTDFIDSMIFYSELEKGKSISSPFVKIKDDKHLLQLLLKHT